MILTFSSIVCLLLCAQPSSSIFGGNTQLILQLLGQSGGFQSGSQNNYSPGGMESSPYDKESTNQRPPDSPYEQGLGGESGTNGAYGGSSDPYSPGGSISPLANHHLQSLLGGSKPCGELLHHKKSKIFSFK